jgi:hypothetical protein
LGWLQGLAGLLLWQCCSDWEGFASASASAFSFFFSCLLLAHLLNPTVPVGELPVLWLALEVVARQEFDQKALLCNRKAVDLCSGFRLVCSDMMEAQSETLGDPWRYRLVG